MNRATVAIIGGGFSGTVAAIRFLTAARNGGPSLPFGSKVVLIEPTRAGEGLAYRAGPDYWRLNVPAEKLSAFPEWPDDFLAWARSRNPLVQGGDFLPRAWYGDYLADRIELAKHRSPRWLSFEHVRSRATGIEVVSGGARGTGRRRRCRSCAFTHSARPPQSRSHSRRTPALTSGSSPRPSSAAPLPLSRKPSPSIFRIRRPGLRSG